MITNCILYLRTILSPQLLIVAAGYAVLVTILARLLLVPLALLVNKAPRWFSFLVNVLSVLLAILASAPIVYVLTAAGLRRVNEETVLAARTLGMKNAVIRRQVILPQARRWIRTGLVLCALRAFCDALIIAVVLHLTYTLF